MSGERPQGMGIDALGGLTDEDFKRTILRALRLLAAITVVGMAFCWWKAGWKSAALLLVGAGISGSGLWEWMRLMVAVMERMDEGAVGRPIGQSMGLEAANGVTTGSVQVRPIGQSMGAEAANGETTGSVQVRPMGQSMGLEAANGETTGSVQVRPMAGVLVGFFVRLGLTGVVLYVSLKYLNGSVYALAAGLGLGVFALTIEGIRLVRAWTV